MPRELYTRPARDRINSCSEKPVRPARVLLITRASPVPRRCQVLLDRPPVATWPRGPRGAKPVDRTPLVDSDALDNGKKRSLNPFVSVNLAQFSACARS